MSLESLGTWASGVFLSTSSVCVGGFVGGGRTKSGSEDDAVELLSLSASVSGGVGGNCISFDAAYGCG